MSERNQRNSQEARERRRQRNLRRNRTRARRIETWSKKPFVEASFAIVALGWEPGQKALETLVAQRVAQHVLPPVTDVLAQKIGDYGDTYLIAASIDLAISLTFPNAPRWARRTAGVIAGTTASFVAEVPQLNALASHVIPHSLLGTPDFPGDVPFAFLGSAVWLGINVWANRPSRRNHP
jgi:hypothetical protein